MADVRRILLDGFLTEVISDRGELVARDGRRVAVDEAIHLAPCQPTKIICVHLNYASRVDEFMTKLPPAPTYFHKPVTALTGHGADVVRPEGCEWLNYEGEIAIIIGKTCRDVAPDEAGDYIAGYSVANDYGLHDFRDTDAGSMLRVKGSDTLCPVGPALVSDWDFRGKRIRTIVNGEVKQDGNTDEMAWDMHYLVADIARTITPWNVAQPDRVRADVDPNRCGRSTERLRGSDVDSAGWRLGVPRHPGSAGTGRQALREHRRRCRVSG